MQVICKFDTLPLSARVCLKRVAKAANANHVVKDGRLIFVDSHCSPDPHCKGICADISVYPAGCSLTDHKSEFWKMEFFIELKDEEEDPFRDRAPKSHSKFPFLRDTREAKQTMGRIGAYADALQGMQFRIYVFSILICGRYARLIYWNRGGAVVTRRFDYQIPGRTPLTEFIWHYSQLDREGRGHDMTVTPFPNPNTPFSGSIELKLFDSDKLSDSDELSDSADSDESKD